MNIALIVCILIIVSLVAFIVFLNSKIKRLTGIEKQYILLSKNYSAVTVLQEIMVILGAKIPASQKLQKINDIFIDRFGMAYSSIVEATPAGNIVKASNLPEEFLEDIILIDKLDEFTESLSNNIPKYISATNMLGYPSARERGIRSALVFALYKDEQYKGFWIMEDIRVSAFDNIEQTQISIIKDNISLILQNNDYAINLENKTFELEKANKKLGEMANRDGLTGLFNKAYMHKTLDEIFTNNRRQAAVAILDIDNFKNYNDKNGHLAGDRLLRSLSDLVTSSLRTRDMLFRFGGEEFVMLFMETSQADVSVIVERLRQQISDFKFPYEENQPNGDLTVSIGVAFCPEDSIEKSSLLQIADERLYKAKSGGRNRVVLSDES